MNTNKSDDTEKAGMDFPVRSKSLTPAVLGMSNSHGVKLSVKMTSEEKKTLMSKLEEWRKAKRDKLAARILAKNQLEKTKTSVPVLPAKSRPPSIQRDGASKLQDQQSVFERLYNNNSINNGKMKKLNGGLNRPTLIPKSNLRKSSLTVSKRQNKPVQASHVVATNAFHVNTESSVVVKENEVSENNQAATENSEVSCDDVLANESENIDGITNVQEPTGLSELNCMETEKKPVAASLEVIHPTEKTEANFHLVLEGFGKKPGVQSVEDVKQKNPLRRSISMMFRQKCKNEYTICRSFSAKNLKEFNLSQRRLNLENVRSVPHCPSNNVKDGKGEVASKSVSFVTPKHNKSVGSNTLRVKLENWLKKNGHPLESYRHLRCFGIANSERSFPSAAAPPLDHSFENSYYATAPNTPLNDSNKENHPPLTVVNQVDIKLVENWLKELHRLAVELKYPPERCDEWLTAIRKKCNICTQLPIYWECLAALHESKGDLESAIEDYERAIIKGGEVDAVGESLAQLFDKMLIDQNRPSKPKLEKGLDPKNIFKSTIIKFALQQKAIKKLSSEIDPGVRQQLYVATPVRRSTRIQTPYKSHGEVSSLQTLTPELRKNLIFKPNESLLRGD